MMATGWKAKISGGALAMVMGGVVLSSTAAAQSFPPGNRTATNLDCRGCVNAREIGKKAVTAAKIRSGAVGTNKIKKNSVTSGRIKNGTIRPKDLSASAKPAGIAFSSGDQDVAIGGAHAVYRTVTLDAPADGYAMVNASWVIYGINITARCSITTGSTVDTDHEVVIEESAGSLINLSGAAVRAYPVTAGANTFNLVCYATIGSPNIRDSSLVALYAPASY